MCGRYPCCQHVMFPCRVVTPYQSGQRQPPDGAPLSSTSLCHFIPLHYIVVVNSHSVLRSKYAAPTVQTYHTLQLRGSSNRKSGSHLGKEVGCSLFSGCLQFYQDKVMTSCSLFLQLCRAYYFVECEFYNLVDNVSDTHTRFSI